MANCALELQHVWIHHCFVSSVWYCFPTRSHARPQQSHTGERPILPTPLLNSNSGIHKLHQIGLCQMPNALEALLGFLLSSVLAKSACESKTGPDEARQGISGACQGRRSPILLQVRHGLTSQVGATPDCQTTVPGEKCYQEIMANDSYIFADQGQSFASHRCDNCFFFLSWWCAGMRLFLPFQSCTLWNPALYYGF